MPTPTQTQTATPNRADAPIWSRATTLLAKEAFDVRSRDDFVSALEAFAELAPGERAFHHAHLVFRQVQAMEDIHRVLVRIDQKLGVLDDNALAGLKQLPAIRKALVSIAHGQEDLLEVIENGAGTKVGGDDEADDDDDEHAPDGDDTDGEDDDEASELEDAVDAEIVEEEDHGNGDGDAIVPEVLPAGARRAPSLTAEEILARRGEGGAS